MKADKTDNHYKVDANIGYGSIKMDVNKFYRKSLSTWENNIKREASKITTELKIEDRIYKLHKRQAFITVKDLNNPQ